MPYNPTFHHRRSIRLKGYDYSQAGLYFVTICCQGKICRFGKIEKDEMILNESGQIACNEWVMLPERYLYATLDVFQIMPNHIHGIIALNATAFVGATLAVAQNAVALNNGMNIANRATARVAPTIGNMVGAYKSSVMNKCLGKLWQRNYYEHIIRNEQSHHNISDYIINNPANWKDDKFYYK
jgi:REP element-mobilizing transposase RayT